MSRSIASWRTWLFVVSAFMFIARPVIGIADEKREGVVHAVLVGVNHYGGSYKFEDKNGNVENAVETMIDAIKTFVQKYGFKKYKITALTDRMDGSSRILSADGASLVWGTPQDDHLKTNDHYITDPNDSNIRWGAPTRGKIFNSISQIFINETTQKLATSVFHDFIEDDTLIFYFAGHGEAEAINKNLVLHVKWAGMEDKGGEDTKIYVAEIISRARSTAQWRVRTPKRVLVFLDNCRNKINTTSISGMNMAFYDTLETVETPKNFLTMFATTPNAYAIINRDKNIGYFTEYLARALKGDIKYSYSYPGRPVFLDLSEYVETELRRQMKTLKQDDPNNESKYVQSPRAFYLQHQHPLAGGLIPYDAVLYQVPLSEADVSGSVSSSPLPYPIRRSWKDYSTHLAAQINKLRSEFHTPIKVIAPDRKNDAIIGAVRGFLDRRGGPRRDTSASSSNLASIASRTESTDEIDTIIKAHAAHPYFTDNATLNIVVTQLLKDKLGWSLRWLFIDPTRRRQARLRVMPVVDREGKPATPENFVYSLEYVTNELVNDLKEFDDRLKRKNFFVSCFPFDRFTRSMMPEYYKRNANYNSASAKLSDRSRESPEPAARTLSDTQELENRRLLELWETFPQTLATSLVTSAGFELYGFRVDFLKPAAMTDCARYVPEAGGKAKPLEIGETYPADEYGEKKYNYIVGGIVKSDKGRIEVEPRINHVRWGEFAKDATPPQVAIGSSRFEDMVSLDQLSVEIARALKRVQENYHPEHDRMKGSR
jgi:hypothetical protein